MKLTTIFAATLAFVLPAAASAQYAVDKLVSNVAGAAHTDVDLINPWGISIGPVDFWISDNGTAKSTFYDANGVKTGVTNIPGPGGNPTGTVYNPTSGFAVNGFTCPFLFDSEDGTISGWYPFFSSTAFIAVNNSAAGAIYKGLAISGSTIYAADFGRNRVEMYSDTFQLIGTFTDPNMEAGYAPFNVQTLGDSIYVSYALRDGTTVDEVDGAGLGIVDRFSTTGVLQQRMVSHGALNAPWGMAIAPSNFGALSGALLIGNFGDGRINAYNVTTGAFISTLNDSAGAPIVLPGLWALQFGTGTVGATNTLFFTAGINAELGGLFGAIRAVAIDGLSLSLSSTSVYGGTGLTGTVLLNNPAPTGGASVVLASNNASAVVPPTLSIAAGLSNGNFSITTTPVTVNTPVTISAAYASKTSQKTVLIVSPKLANFTVSATTVAGGGTLNGTVTLYSPAATGGTVVALTKTGAVSVPSNATVTAGATTKTFLIGSSPVTVDTSSTVKATLGTVNITRTIVVKAPGLASITSQTGVVSVFGGTSLAGKATLTGGAPAGGLLVTLSSNNPAAVVPASVNVPAGSTSVGFTISTVPVTVDTSVTLTGTADVTRTLTITVKKPVLTTFTISPGSVKGGLPAVGIVGLSSPAPAGGIMVTFVVGAPLLVHAPVSVLIPAGATAKSFTITTSAVASSVNIQVNAKAGTVTITRFLQLTP